jgi:HEAT repeat protein
LLEALQRGDAKTRSTAARVLSARGVPAATKALQASEEASLSLPVAFALSIAGAGAEEIEAILVELETRHDPEVLLLSARALIDRKALPEAAVLLERVVVESEGMYRKGAVVMLSDCGLAGLRALVRVMKHCTQERWTAAMSVGNIEGVEVLAELAPLVYEDNYGPLKWAAAFEMCREVYPPAIAAMKEVLIEGDVIDRRIAAETIRGLCLDGCEEVLALAATCDHDPAVRLYSGSFIPGHLRGVRRESFRRSSDGVPRSPETLPPLIDILENGNPSERAWAAIALGQAGRPKAAPALFEALFDGEDLVALEARRAIESLPV